MVFKLQKKWFSNHKTGMGFRVYRKAQFIDKLFFNQNLGLSDEFPIWHVFFFFFSEAKLCYGNRSLSNGTLPTEIKNQIYFPF